MGSVLWIKNDLELDQKLLERLGERFTVHVATNTWDGLNVMDDHHIDVFVIQSTHHIEEKTWELLDEIHTHRPIATPIIFASETPNETLITQLHRNISWSFIPYPINRDHFLDLMSGAMSIADSLDDKTIQLERSGHVHYFKVKNISRIKRLPNRWIQLYILDPKTGEEIAEDFFFKKPLAYFAEKHEIQNRLLQAHQSWLVNQSHVKIVKPTHLELELISGATVPTSLKYLDNFREKKGEK